MRPLRRLGQRQGEVGEKSVGIGRRRIDFREQQLGSRLNESAIDFAAADDKHLAGIGAGGQRLLGSGVDLGAGGSVVAAARNNDVAPPGQRPFGERFKGFAPHDDRVAERERLESAQVVGNVKQQVAAAPDGPVGADGCDNLNFRCHSCCKFPKKNANRQILPNRRNMRNFAL